MDEAERCHRIVYIAQGKIVVRGTVAEVIGQSRLSTWLVRGPDQAALVDTLRALPGVEQVAAFGSGLHVVGADGAALAASLQALAAAGRIELAPAETSLEDVFIRLMAQPEGLPA